MEPTDTGADPGGNELTIPLSEDRERESWEEVRDSWVGDRRSAPEPVEPEPATRPRTVPPPLPVRLAGDCRQVGDAVGIMFERLAASDYEAALRVAESVLRREPDHVDALQASAICKSELQHLYAARLGDTTRVPSIVVCAEQLRSTPVDAQAGLVLSMVDGTRTIDEIAAGGRVAPLDALRILSELFFDGVVVLSEPGGVAEPS